MVCTTVLTSCAQLATQHALDQSNYILSLIYSGALKTDTQLLTALMNTYVKCGQSQKALEVWIYLEQSTHSITSHITCVCALSACANMGTKFALEIGKRIHAITTSVKWNHPQLLNALITMYTKCNNPELAMQLWRQQVQHQANSIQLYTSMLITCAKIGPPALSDGIWIYSEVAKSEILQPDLQFYAAVVTMYSKCGQSTKALSLWQTIRTKYSGLYSKCIPLLTAVLSVCNDSQTAQDIGTTIHLCANEVVSQNSGHSVVVFYTALISMYTRCGFPEKAVAVYDEMLQKQVQPGTVSYTCVLTACGAIGPSSLAKGRQIYNTIQHNEIIDIALANSLLSMLVKCGVPLEALHQWKTLTTNPSFTASTVTHICVLAACADIGPPAISDGLYIHSLLNKDELKQEDVMAALLTMHTRCGQPLRSLELWKYFIASSEIKSPTSPALYTAIFTTCATLRSTEALEIGIAAQNMMDRSLMTSNSITNTALIQMHAQCGNPTTALTIWINQLQNQPLIGDGGKSDKIRILSTLSVCSMLGNNTALQIGKQLAHIVDTSTYFSFSFYPFLFFLFLFPFISSITLSLC